MPGWNPNAVRFFLDETLVFTCTVNTGPRADPFRELLRLPAGFARELICEACTGAVI